jgi:hypothetical protein
MQILSLAGLGFLAQTAAPAVASAAPTQSFMEYARGIYAGDWMLAAWFVLAQLVTIISFWMASKAIVDRNELDDTGPSFGQAVLAWFIVFIFAAAMLVAWAWCFYKTGPFLQQVLKNPGAKPNFSPEMATPFLMLAGVGFVYLLVRIFAPMRVYRLGCGGASVFFIFTIILEAIFGFGLRLAFRGSLDQAGARIIPGSTAGAGQGGGSTIFQGKQQFSAKADTLANRAADKRRSMPDRQQALKDLYDALEKYRETLDVNANPVGVREYETQRARYEQILSDLKAEVAGKR